METTEEKLTRIEAKVDAVYTSAEKSRKYMLSMLIITLVMIGLPILLAIFVVPIAIQSLGSVYSL